MVAYFMLIKYAYFYCEIVLLTNQRNKSKIVKHHYIACTWKIIFEFQKFMLY